MKCPICNENMIISDENIAFYGSCSDHYKFMIGETLATQIACIKDIQITHYNDQEMPSVMTIYKNKNEYKLYVFLDLYDKNIYDRINKLLLLI